MPSVVYYDEVKYIVGRNAADNWRIIEEADGYDLWVHLQDQPSCHVIIENTKELTKDHILYGCNLCKEFSKITGRKTVRLSVLERRHIKKGKCVGEVTLLSKPNVYSM
jgi:predicted ribosome quality control (RQC) complex YloA/Tae2 family protein